MKNSLIIFSLFLLASCAHWDHYQPQLASQPKDKDKYETDRKYCINEVPSRQDRAASFDHDSVTSPRQMVDECMVSKGYDVTKVDHSFFDIFKKDGN